MDVSVKPPVVTQEELNTWYRLQRELSAIKAQELTLRKKVFAAFFPSPVEGTNTAPLTDGWVLKGQHKITREVDVATLDTLLPELVEAGIPVEDLIVKKPQLVIAQYRELTAEERLLFDQVLVIKDGAPALEIVLPKR